MCSISGEFPCLAPERIKRAFYFSETKLWSIDSRRNSEWISLNPKYWGGCTLTRGDPSLVPRLLWGRGENEPGTHCLCMHSSRRNSAGLENCGYYTVISFRLWSYYHPLHWRETWDVSFALHAIGKEGLKLKQFAMFMTEKVCLYGCLQGLASQCVTRCSPWVRPQGMKQY